MAVQRAKEVSRLGYMSRMSWESKSTEGENKMNRYYKLKRAVHYLLVVVFSPLVIPATIITMTSERFFGKVGDWVGEEPNKHETQQ